MFTKALAAATLSATALCAVGAPVSAATYEITFRDYYSGTDDGVYAMVTLRFANAVDNSTTFGAADLVDRVWVNTDQLATNATYSVNGIGQGTYPENFGLDQTTGFTDDNYYFYGTITSNGANRPTFSYGMQFIDYDDPAKTLDDRVYNWTFTGTYSRWRSYYYYSPAMTTLPMLVDISGWSYDATATEFVAAQAPDSAVPIPAAGGLLATGLMAVAALRRRA